MIVQLSESAFLSVVLASIEAYKKESYGLILGHRTARQWRVEYAVAYQTAARGHKTVTPHGLRDRRVRACLARLSDYEVLGAFHSHPAWGRLRAIARPSPTDTLSLPSGELELIVAVNDARRARRFGYRDGGRVLTGTVLDFSLSIAAFYKPPIRDFSLDSPVRRTLIRCPYTLGFEPDGAMK